MIRYPTTLAQLRKSVTEESAEWLRLAAERTEGFRAKGRYEEASSIWSDVKAVYMRLQGSSKCAYCERKLESVDFGRIEQDVEHFRPKGSVKAWPGQKAFPGLSFTPAPPAGKGYYLLPYHLLNYAAACKPCNSTLKKDYFPAAGPLVLEGENPAALDAELAYLIYPIGRIDEDPEKLITFEGTSPRPVVTRGHRRNRALVTIEFFKLDDATRRKNLFRERAQLLMVLFPQLEKASDPAQPAAERAKARATIDRFEASLEVPHANCVRSFIRLHRTQPAKAKEFFDAAEKLVLSIS